LFTYTFRSGDSKELTRRQMLGVGNEEKAFGRGSEMPDGWTKADSRRIGEKRARMSGDKHYEEYHETVADVKLFFEYHSNGGGRY
jgi:hypothetical protein